MTRPAVLLLAAGALLVGGCGGPTMPPLQVEQASASKMAALKSVRANLTVLVTGSTVGTNAGAKPMPFTMSLNGNGAFESIPRALDLNLTMSVGGFSGKTEVILAGDEAYVKNPVNGKWTNAEAVGLNADAFNLSDPTVNLQYMQAAKSVTDLGDGTVDNQQAHHYRLVLDSQKVLDQTAQKPYFKDPKLQATVQQAVDAITSGSFTYEVFIGTSDSLVYRMIVDLTSVPSAAGATSFSLSNFHARVQMDFHDFDAPVSIKAPI